MGSKASAWLWATSFDHPGVARTTAILLDLLVGLSSGAVLANGHFGAFLFSATRTW